MRRNRQGAHCSAGSGAGHGTGKSVATILPRANRVLQSAGADRVCFEFAKDSQRQGIASGDLDVFMSDLLLELGPMEDRGVDCGERQPLNPLDQALCSIDRAIRGMGYQGFETLMLVWLSERVHAGQVREAIERLSRRRPTITARLVDGDSAEVASAYWRMTHSAAALQEIELSSGDPEAVLASAAKLLSTTHDPAIEPP